MIRIIIAALLSCISINIPFADQIVVLNKHFTHTAEGGADKYMGFCLFQPSIDLPQNLVDPVDYSNGTVYFRLKVNSKPSNKPAWYNFGFQQGTHPFAEHFCDRIEITTAKTYEWNQPLSTWWKPNDPKLHVDYSKPVNRLMAVLWDENPQSQPPIGRPLGIRRLVDARYHQILFSHGRSPCKPSWSPTKANLKAFPKPNHPFPNSASTPSTR